MKKIKADRICACGCKGLVSGKSYRTKHGSRKRYFENITHIENWYEKQLKKYLPKGMKPSKKTIETESKKYIKEFLEPVYIEQYH